MKKMQLFKLVIALLITLMIMIYYYTPGSLITTILIGLFWFMIISIKLFRLFPGEENGDGDNGDTSVRNKKYVIYRADRKQCATCMYWSGNRELNSQNSQFKVEFKNALCKVSQMTRDPITQRIRAVSPKNTPPNFGLNCKYHKHLS